jgi:hypothetical protein
MQSVTVWVAQAVAETQRSPALPCEAPHQMASVLHAFII